MESNNKKSKRFLVAIIVLAMIFQLVAPMTTNIAYAEEEGQVIEAEVGVEEDNAPDAEPPVEENEEQAIEEPEAEEPEAEEPEVEEPEEPEEPEESEVEEPVVEDEEIEVESKESEEIEVKEEPVLSEEENTDVKKGPRRKGSIEFIKTDEEGKPLEGARFGLYRKGQNHPVTTETSKKSGLIKFTNVPFGEYVIKEIGAPEGYELSEETRYVEISKGNKKEKLGKFENVKKNTEPEPRYGRIKLTKTDEEGNPLEGAEFGLYDKSDTKFENPIKPIATSGMGGLVIFLDVPFGEYTIKEIKAPEGYKLSESLIKVNLTPKNYEHCETIKNEKKDTKSGDVKLKKVDEEGNPLEGARFGIYDKDNTLVQTRTTDRRGMLKFEDIPLGDYVIREIEAPEGYKLLSEEFEISIKNNGKVYSVGPIKNEKKDTEPEPEPRDGSVRLKKVDENGRTLTGARFGIYDEYGNLVKEQISDRNGLVRFNYIPIGDYTVREISAPAGYEISDRIINVKVVENGERVNLGIFINYKPETPDTPDTPDIPDTPDTPDIPDTPTTPDIVVPTPPEIIEEDEEIEEIEEIEEEIPEAVVIPDVDDEVEVVEETIDEEIPESPVVIPISYEKPKDIEPVYAQSTIKPAAVRDRLVKTGSINDIIFYIGGLVLILAGLFFRKKVV